MKPSQRHIAVLLPDAIFLTGRMGSGKDFVAAQLIEHAGFTRLAFADALKEEVAARHGISVEELNARKAEFRAELQSWGVSRREVDPYYWIRQWELRRRAIEGPVVCTDVRFPNEAEYGQQISAMLIRIKVSDALREARLRARDGSFDPATLNHISEQHIDELLVHAELPGNLPADIILPVLIGIDRLASNASPRQGLIALGAMKFCERCWVPLLYYDGLRWHHLNNRHRLAACTAE